MLEEQNNRKGLRMADALMRQEADGSITILQSKGLGNKWEQVLLQAGCATTREMRSDATGIFFPQLFSHCYTAKEKWQYWLGKELCNDSPYDDEDILLQGEEPFVIPVFFISGLYDYTTPVNAVELFYENIDAPLKDIRVFEDSAHSPLWEENEAVLDYMGECVERLSGITNLN